MGSHAYHAYDQCERTPPPPEKAPKTGDAPTWFVHRSLRAVCDKHAVEEHLQGVRRCARRRHRNVVAAIAQVDNADGGRRELCGTSNAHPTQCSTGGQRMSRVWQCVGRARRCDAVRRRWRPRSRSPGIHRTGSHCCTGRTLQAVRPVPPHPATSASRPGTRTKHAFSPLLFCRARTSTDCVPPTTVSPMLLSSNELVASGTPAVRPPCNPRSVPRSAPRVCVTELGRLRLPAWARTVTVGPVDHLQPCTARAGPCPQRACTTARPPARFAP